MGRGSLTLVIGFKRHFVLGSGLGAKMDKLLQLGGGTLGVVLAKKDFIVVSTDSRRTDRASGQYTDDCKKLFCVGKHRVLAVAGLLDATLTRLPSLTAQVVPLLKDELRRSEQWHDLEWKDKPSPPMAYLKN